MSEPEPAPRLRDYILPYRREMAVGSVLLLLSNVLDKSAVWVLGSAVDALGQRASADVIRYALIALGLAATMWFVRATSRIRLFNVGRDVEYDLRSALLQRVHRLGASFFQTMPTGEVMSRATNDIGQLRLLVGFGVLNVVNSIFAFTLSIGLMLAISPRLTLYALAPYPIFIFIARAFSKALYPRSLAAQEALGRLADVAQENLAGVRIVRTYGLEGRSAESFEAANQNAIEANMRLAVLRGLMWPVLMMVGSLGSLIVLFKGGQMVLAADGSLSAGEFARFFGYLGQLVWPTLALGYLLSVVQRGRASFDRVSEILGATPEVRERPDAKPAGHEGALSVSSLSFSRGDRQILDDVSFDVPAGSSVAVVGTVGSGKSTLAALLPRLLPTPEKSVELDGDCVTELELRSLRRSVGYAQQEPFLFSTTIGRNVSLALDEPDAPDADERVRHACREAAILDEIEQMPEGFDTLVGERGVQLSGGQKQRIALARALLNEPTVIVLDDPLSAVDARTEGLILDAIGRAGEDRTLVLVTQRVAAAAETDRVVVLDGGRVVEQGSHDELLKEGGLYARLAERQALERELRA